jgi:hypothetical protein
MKEIKYLKSTSESKSIENNPISLDVVQTITRMAY